MAHRVVSLAKAAGRAQCPPSWSAQGLLGHSAVLGDSQHRWTRRDDEVHRLTPEHPGNLCVLATHPGLLLAVANPLSGVDPVGVTPVA
jgi:hypothetical protein